MEEIKRDVERLKKRVNILERKSSRQVTQNFPRAFVLILHVLVH